MIKTEQQIIKSRAWVTGMFVFGILMLVVGLIEMAFMPASTGGGFSAAFISAGTVMVIFTGLRLSKGEKNYMQDERTKKIGAYGLSWSWFLTLLVLFAVFWADYLHLWSPDAQTLSVLLILLMGISAKASQAYLFRKGDVE